MRDDGDAEMFANLQEGGSLTVGLLYTNDSVENNIRISWGEIGFKGKMKVRDLWEHQDLGEFSEYFEKLLKPHQCIVVRVINEK